MHVAFKVRTVGNSTAWMIKKIPKAIYNMFHDSPDRQEDYVDITESDEFSLPFPLP